MNNRVQRQYLKLLVVGSIIILFGIILMVVPPIIFTQYSYKYDFRHTGEIGDTIGGITAPIAAIIGAILIFVSFLEQWKANKIQTGNILNIRKFEISEKRASKLSKLFKDNYRKGDDEF